VQYLRRCAAPMGELQLVRGVGAARLRRRSSHQRRERLLALTQS
jgi:hypothetical protein